MTGLAAGADFAYGALAQVVARRLGAPGEPAALVPAEVKRELLLALAHKSGPEAIVEAGREVAEETAHPFVRVLRAQQTPERMFDVWMRLEVLAHSQNRVSVLALTASNLELLRFRARGSAEATAEEEDLLVLGILEGLLSRFGFTRFRVLGPRMEPRGRRWRIEFQQAQRPPENGESSGRIWCAEGELERAAFAAAASLVASEERVDLRAVAGLLSLSPRTLQRRLAAGGASFSALLRAARVTCAGDSIAREQRALTEIAHRFGFSDSAHMSREFRNLLGCAPRELAFAARAQRGA